MTRRMLARGGVRAAFAIPALIAVACGPAAPSARPLGEEAVVEDTIGSDPGIVTTLGVTVLAVRTGTVEELEAGFNLDPDEREATPLYVDVRYENRGDKPIPKEPRVSMEDSEGDLITPVTIIDLGGDTVFEPCEDNRDGEAAPGEAYESCTLFLVDAGRRAARVSFLPIVAGKESEWVYWQIPE